ncbi:N-acetylmuramoyl-L-alanine amidase [Yinghuangia seranimata]|uniref:N-acetylmuramoyl-L-alanine amidase n=1 Tax=Yinghuangia seranimata TaxID=408067 RepID=UPI00248B625E|nr:N-acetylmuramoyl-L-alanine amidase [Yinghuangia seranimata]MDI2128545.1 N-acetylmuramoyl-L-alanine amidase [Yinghuangia seranimata]
MPSDPWEQWDSPPAPRRRPQAPQAAEPRRTRVVVGAAVAALVLVGGGALAMAWTGDDGSPTQVVGGATDPTAVGVSTDSSGTGVPSGSGAQPNNQAAQPPTSSSASVPGPPADSTAPNPPATPANPGKPLAGKTIVIDPGHNPGNARHTSEIGRQVDAGGFRKNCDETGTETNAGYTEAQFTLDVAQRARRVLTDMGAKVVFTWDNDRAWGPCVDERARIGNDAHADAVVSIHGDGAPSTGSGFHVIVPATVKAGTADTGPIIAPSRALGDALVGAFTQATHSHAADYIGTAGIDVRSDLGGLNLSKVPKVFIECGNMRNAGDAQRMTDPTWRQTAAEGVANGIRDYLMKGT